MDHCATCRNLAANLPEPTQEALTLLPVDQYLAVLLGLCDGCLVGG
jgi:hypothetical protein